MENGRNGMSPGDLSDLVGGGELLRTTRVAAGGPEGRLPITPEMLLKEPSGNLFGMTQNAGMGWDPAETGRPQFLILSTQGGLRDADGSPVALGYHTGHWEIGLLVRAAAESAARRRGVPFAACCSDPCDGRTQGTAGMFDSLPYRNDAAIVLRRLIRSLPGGAGVMGVATCDKGLPAMMMALAGCRDLPGIIVPGGVTLPAIGAEDAGKVQTHRRAVRARPHQLETRRPSWAAARADPRAAAVSSSARRPPRRWWPRRSGSPCRTARSARRASRSGSTIGPAIGRCRSCGWPRSGSPLAAILTPRAIENAMVVHAAFGGSTNLLLHIPAIAHAAGLPRPTVDDWNRVNRATPRLVDALPNGPRNHPTVQVFLAGGVPEVMLHLRDMGLLNLDVLTVTGATLGDGPRLVGSERAARSARARACSEADGVDPGRVIMGPDAARRAGLARTDDASRPATSRRRARWSRRRPSTRPSWATTSVYRHRGPARVFTSESRCDRRDQGAGTRRARGRSPAMSSCSPAPARSARGWRRPTSSPRRSSTSRGARPWRS